MVDVNVTTIPNAARVYDYMLGGDHNYEPDRHAAHYMSSLIPSTRTWVHRLRKFLHLASLQLVEQGFDRFLDLGSGLPTSDHIHATAPNARVVYVDNDPIVFAYGTEILGNHSNARYLNADIREIAAVLESPVTRELLGDARRVAIGFNAITCFLSDEEIRSMGRALYEWAPSGSKMFATFETKAPEAMTSKLQQFVDMFDQMGSPYHFLTPERSKALMEPWVEDAQGFRPLFEWLGEDEPPTEEREGVDLEFYGTFLVKP